jgi:hypothetical protein
MPQKAEAGGARARAGSSQIQLSNSPREILLKELRIIRRSHQGVRHRPLWWCGAGPAPSFPCPSHARGERSAERRNVLHLHLAVPRAV